VESDQAHAAVDDDRLTALSLSVSRTASVLFSAGSVTDTLARVVEVAITTIEGCDYAGLLLSNGGAVTTPVHTDQVVLEVDALQYKAGQGPCLDAIADRVIVYADDLDTDVRWPEFSPAAVRAGIRSVLALPLTPSTHDGALNLYARYPAAFGVVDRATAAILTSLASLALSVAHAHEDEVRRAENLNAALTSRETIGEALGILWSASASRPTRRSMSCVVPPNTSTSSCATWRRTWWTPVRVPTPAHLVLEPRGRGRRRGSVQVPRSRATPPVVC
jgi:GAF domain-containing protein